MIHIPPGEGIELSELATLPPPGQGKEASPDARGSRPNHQPVVLLVNELLTEGQRRGLLPSPVEFQLCLKGVDFASGRLLALGVPTAVPSQPHRWWLGLVMGADRNYRPRVYCGLTEESGAAVVCGELKLDRWTWFAGAKDEAWDAWQWWEQCGQQLPELRRRLSVRLDPEARDKFLLAGCRNSHLLWSRLGFADLDIPSVPTAWDCLVAAGKEVQKRPPPAQLSCLWGLYQIMEGLVKNPAGK